mgnify:CR=1 FL=1
MKARVKKKKLKRYDRKHYMTILTVDISTIIKKRRKTILRLQKVKPWMLNEVLIRYTFMNDIYTYTNYIQSRSTSLEKNGELT